MRRPLFSRSRHQRQQDRIRALSAEPPLPNELFSILGVRMTLHLEPHPKRSRSSRRARRILLCVCAILSWLWVFHFHHELRPLQTTQRPGSRERVDPRCFLFASWMLISKAATSASLLARSRAAELPPRAPNHHYATKLSLDPWIRTRTRTRIRTHLEGASEQQNM